MDDEKIVALYWDRNEQAIEETSAKYGGYCGQIARNILDSGPDAEECVNDTWLQAWNSMPDERPRRLSAFLGAITRRLAISRWRAETRQKRGGGELPLALEELAECIPADSDPEERVEQKELAEAIRHFVSTLKEEERQVFIARYWYLASMEEIACGTGFSVSKVKTLLFRQRGRLRTYLTEEGLL